MNKKKRPEVQLPKDVIEFYAKWRNRKSKFVRQEKAGVVFEIDERYEILEVIGKGAYAIVAAARDKLAKDKSREIVAIKKIEMAFEHKIFAKRTLRELKLLRLLRHENILEIFEIMLPPSREKFDDIYYVAEYMETDLGYIIKSKQELTEEHHQFLLYQLLRGMK